MERPGDPRRGPEIPVSSAARWGTAGQLGGQLLRFGVLLVLAKLLDRGDWALLEMALYVTGFVEIVKSLGTSEFLIRERRLPPGLVASVFWFNVGVGFAISAALWFGAGAFALLFADGEAPRLIAWLGLTFAILSFGHVHEALLRRELAFKRLAVALFCGPLAYAVAATCAALAGWNEMSFVAGAIAEAVVMTALLWWLSGWRPRSGFAWSEARKAFHFSFFLTGSEAVRWLTANADIVIVRRALGRDALGVYGLARRIVIQVTKPLILIFHRVALPALAPLQHNPEETRARYLRATSSIALIAFPALAGICALADPLVAILDPAKWEGAVSVLRVLAPASAVLTAASTVGVLYLLRSRTDLLFLWSVVSGATFVAAFAAGVAWGIDGVAVATAAALAILLWPALLIPYRLIGLRVGAALAALGPVTAASTIMGAFVFGLAEALAHAGIGPLVALCAGILLGAGVYLWLIRLLQPPGIEDLIAVVPARLRPLAGRSLSR